MELLRGLSIPALGAFRNIIGMSSLRKGVNQKPYILFTSKKGENKIWEIISKTYCEITFNVNYWML
jgi:hypothetical protein